VGEPKPVPIPASKHFSYQFVANRKSLEALHTKCFNIRYYQHGQFVTNEDILGKSSESVQCAMLKACDVCADMGQL